MSEHEGLPGYWPNEVSGVLRPVVETYLNGDELTPEQVGVMRAYLRQWINAPFFVGREVDELRATLDTITDTAGIRSWLADALNAGVDPL